MTQAVELIAESAPPADDGHRHALLAALRVAHVKLRMALHEVEDIGAELKAGRMTPREAMRLCVNLRLDALFPRESDGA
jgi:hypothetical protein